MFVNQVSGVKTKRDYIERYEEWRAAAAYI
jgi:hypothetical protein